MTTQPATAARTDAPALRLNDYLPYRLSVASNAVSELVARAYQSRFGLTIPQWRIIAVLAEDGAATQQTICSRTVMDKVTISRAARALTERGLISRAPHHRDGRSHRLGLSPDGRALYAEIAPLALAYEARLLGSFSATDVALAQALLRRLEAAAAALSGAANEPDAARI